MIGQEELLKRIDKMADNNRFPRFVVLVGAKGSGRHLVSSHIAKKLSAPLHEAEIGVDAIRALIPLTYRVTSSHVYLLANVENMSPSARNALLKVTEEPPQNAYFIMTVTDTSFILPTLLSRSTVLYMMPYSAKEIHEFACTTDLPGKELQLVSDVCETPGDVLALKEYEPENFYNYVTLVVDNVDKVSYANLFKVGDKVKVKDTDEGYDLKLFWRMFRTVCCRRMLYDKDKKYINWIVVTSKYLQELKITGVNVPHTFDMWLIELQVE